MSDGGGEVAAARRPVLGARRVASYMVGLAQKGMADMDITFRSYNGMPAVLFSRGDVLDSILLIEIFDGSISGLYAVRNPDKLRRAAIERTLTRAKETDADCHR